MSTFFLLLAATAAAAAAFRARKASADAALLPAVILVATGAEEPEDTKDIVRVVHRIKEAFPCYGGRLAFSSGRIRALWRARSADEGYRKSHLGLDEMIYSVRNVFSVLASVQETGPRLTLVQGLYLVDGPEYHDLAVLVETLRQIKTFDRDSAPFPWIGLGEPALGKGDGQRDNVFRVAGALAPIFKEAEERKAAVLLASDPFGGINPPAYRNLEDALRSLYNVPAAIALHESRQRAADILAGFAATCPPPGPVLIAPLAPVLSPEAREDIAGAGEERWAAVCRSKGYETVTRLQGLASEDAFADILIENLKRQESALSLRYFG
ncbi:MAG: sirohydrochlorin cobaltochelatase [Deltaproteobacteria bacterium]|jgi:cobalamin biosynthesis Co2+ chelatase CbiK|nr:sirohydrochlorin cobaltochelatase [Deltaproteobacteria bacterium]